MTDLIADVDESIIVGFMEEAVAKAFELENTRRQEDRDPTKLTMSGVGGCTRQNAYALAGTPASDVHNAEEARMALLGTGIHDWYLPALARAITVLTGYVCDVEQKVLLTVGDVRIRGQLDLAFGDVVVDLKTVREWKLNGVRRNGAFAEHHAQVFGYALARYQAGYPVRWVIYLYMDRTTGEVEVIAERFSQTAAQNVMRRIKEINAFAADDPDLAPREGRGPGLSLACDRCPWLRRCWGPDAKPGEEGPQVRIAETPDGLREILALYVQAAGVTGRAEADKKFAKLVLSRTTDATYDGYVLRRGDSIPMDDGAAMKAILTELGIPIPTKPKAGAISVKVAPAPKQAKRCRNP